MKKFIDNYFSVKSEKRETEKAIELVLNNDKTLSPAKINFLKNNVPKKNKLAIQMLEASLKRLRSIYVQQTKKKSLTTDSEPEIETKQKTETNQGTKSKVETNQGTKQKAETNPRTKQKAETNPGTKQKKK